MLGPCADPPCSPPCLGGIRPLQRGDRAALAETARFGGKGREVIQRGRGGACGPSEEIVGWTRAHRFEEPARKGEDTMAYAPGERALAWAALLLLWGVGFPGTGARRFQQEQDSQSEVSLYFPPAMEFAQHTLNQEHKDEYAYWVEHILSVRREQVRDCAAPMPCTELSKGHARLSYPRALARADAANSLASMKYLHASEWSRYLPLTVCSAQSA